MILENLSDHAKQTGDALSITTLIAIFFANLPTITAILVFIWTAMRIYESWLGIRLARRNLGEDK